MILLNIHLSSNSNFYFPYSTQMLSLHFKAIFLTTLLITSDPNTNNFQYHPFTRTEILPNLVPFSAFFYTYHKSPKPPNINVFLVTKSSYFPKPLVQLSHSIFQNFSNIPSLNFRTVLVHISKSTFNAQNVIPISNFRFPKLFFSHIPSFLFLHFQNPTV